VKAVDSLTGDTSAKGIEVFGDIESKTITITVSKLVIGPDIPNYRFVIVVGSQDGFGPGKWRDVDAEAKTWRLGGGAAPSASTGTDFDPNVLDIVLEGDGQAAMLSAYDVEAQQPAVLTGIEIPEIEQQIYGVSVSSITTSSAIISWSTTKSADGVVTCDDNNFTTPMMLYSQALQVTGLDAGTAYSCSITVSDAPSAFISFNTSNETDTTPPDLLNLDVEVIEGGSLRVTWYTSEEATESIEVDGQTFAGDAIALRKNHEITISPYPVLSALYTYTLTVTASDASGNTNSSSVDFIIEEEDAASPLPDEGVGPSVPTEESSDTTSIGELFGNPVVQIGLLLVILLVVGALFRTRRHDWD